MVAAAFAVNLFVALFALIDPIGTAPLFAAATVGARPRARARVALYIALFAFAFLTFFFFTGLGLLKFFGISLPAFRIAGGILLLLLGLDMARNDYTPAVADAVAEGEIPDDNAYAKAEFEKLIVPFGMPLLIGPGAISTVVIFASQASGMASEGRVALISGYAAGVAALFVTCLTIFLCFLASGAISRVLGKVGMMIVVRVLGLILSALAVQFILIGFSDATLGIVKRSASNPYPVHAPFSTPKTP